MRREAKAKQQARRSIKREILSRGLASEVREITSDFAKLFIAERQTLGRLVAAASCKWPLRAATQTDGRSDGRSVGATVANKHQLGRSGEASSPVVV